MLGVSKKSVSGDWLMPWQRECAPLGSMQYMASWTKRPCLEWFLVQVCVAYPCCIKYLQKKRLQLFHSYCTCYLFFLWTHLVLMCCGLMLTVDLPEIHFEQLLVTKSSETCQSIPVTRQDFGCWVDMNICTVPPVILKDKQLKIQLFAAVDLLSEKSDFRPVMWALQVSVPQK